jgi:site-specific recombinase XerD
MGELATGSGASLERPKLLEQAHAYAGAAKAPNTWKAYRSDWRQFSAWCDAQGAQALPADPATLVAYLTDAASTVKVATLQRRLSSIAQAHQAAGYPSPSTDPQVRLVWQRIRRTHGTAARRVEPAVTDVIRALVDGEDPDLAATRDRALLLVGFAGALRRSELVALDVTDVTDTPDGLKVSIRRSKTDQEAVGRVVGLPYGSTRATCPARAWRAWLAASGITDGPAFRSMDRHSNLSSTRLSDRAVALIVKRRAELAGLDPASFSGHSLRAGLATAAAMAGVPERVIAAQTGHKSMAVLRGYIREGSIWRENAAAKVGL